MSSPKRYSNGITNVPASNPLGQLTTLDPTQLTVFFDDFLRYSATDWTITTVETGTATEAVGDESGGVLVVTNGTSDNDSDMFQLSADGGTTVAETFKLATGKKAWIKTRCKTSDKTDSEFIVGLVDSDTTPLDASDGMFFIKADDVATLDFKTSKSSVSSTASSIATLVDDTYVELACYYDGVETITYYVDGLPKGTLTDDTLPTTELSVTFGVKNGGAAAKVFSIDYLYIAVEK